MSEKLLKLLKFLLIFGLLCGFVVQILDSLEKYLDGKSSFATSENLKEQPEPLPSFSICSEPSFSAETRYKANAGKRRQDSQILC